MKEKYGIGSRTLDRVSVTKWTGHPRYKWRTSWVECGKRKDKGFRKKTDAEAWAETKSEELRLFGRELSALTHAERAAVIEAREPLSALKLSLRDAIQTALEEHRKRTASEKQVYQLADEILKDRTEAGRSERYLQDLQSRFGKFRETFGDRAISSIDREEIEAWLGKLGVAPRTRNNYLGALRLFFGDGIKRKYCFENPAENISDSKIVQKEAGIFSPDDLQKMIAVVPDDLLPVVLLGAFAGLRRSEIKSLDWSAIDRKQGEIYVNAKIAKVGKIRFVPIEKNLAAWLKPYAEKSGYVWPVNGDDKFNAARDALREQGVAVPDNALRHSYGSYHLSKYKDIGKTAENMGNSPAMIRNSYKRAVPEKVTKKYWSILPGEARKFLNFSEAS